MPTTLLQILQTYGQAIIVLGGIGSTIVAILMYRANRKLTLANANQADANAAKLITDAAATAVDKLLGNLNERIQCLEDQKALDQQTIERLESEIKKAQERLATVVAENIELHQKVAVLLANEKRLRRLNQKLIQAISDNIKARAESAQQNGLPCTVYCAPADQILTLALQEILDDQGDDNAASQ